ncbi:MAG: glycosyltransferase, partial [Acutalibacteraceae bacterium]|nr:glycosyltransferase [Acutalibacteraceae bacterium]
GEFSDLMKACMDSWKKHCPDYEIIEWNETNSNFGDNKYAKDAYEAGKWAFVSDYMRNKIIYENGGIYLDTDVMLLKSLDPLLKHEAYIGWEEGSVNTGLGFGAEKGNLIVKEFMDHYDNMEFWAAPGVINNIIEPTVVKNILINHGMEVRDDIIQQVESFTVYPREYFCPLDIRLNKTKKTPNSYSVHYYTATWYTEEQKAERKELTRKRKAKKLLGERLYKVWEFLYLFFCKGGLKNFFKNRFKRN